RAVECMVLAGSTAVTALRQIHYYVRSAVTCSYVHIVPVGHDDDLVSTVPGTPPVGAADGHVLSGQSSPRGGQGLDCGHELGDARQRAALDVGDAPGGLRPDVQQQPAAAGDDVRVQLRQLARRHRQRGILYLVVAEGEAQPAGVLPGAARLVRDVVRILAGAVVPDRCAPAVVDDPVGHSWAVAGEQRLEGAVLLGRIRPVDVVPEHGGAVSLDQVVH